MKKINFPNLGLTSPEVATTAYVHLKIVALKEDEGGEVSTIEDGEIPDIHVIQGITADGVAWFIAEFAQEAELLCMFCAVHIAYTMGIPIANFPTGFNLAPINAAVFHANNTDTMH